MPTPYTQIRTSHALTIKAGGVEIGSIQSWAPQQARDVRPKYELNAVTTGSPLENVPGISTNLTIQISRFDLYLRKMEEIWGTPKPLHMLTDQFNPIDVEERWVRFGTNRKPLFPGKGGQALSRWNTEDQLRNVGNSNFAKKLGLDLGNSSLDRNTIPENVEVYVEKLWYSGCWFTSLGRQLSAQGDRIVNVNATMVYTKVRPLL